MQPSLTAALSDAVARGRLARPALHAAAACVQDLRAFTAIKPDASGKNILAVLRHVGRLKEVKLGGMRCWQARA